MVFKTEQQLKEIRQNVYGKIWPLLNDRENEHWKHKGGKDRAVTGLIYSKRVEDLGKVFKVEVDVPLTPEILIKELMETEKMLEWCPNLDECRDIEKGQQGEWIVNYCYASKIGPISARDFLSLYFVEVLENGAQLILADGVEHDDVPKRKSTIRGEILPSGTYIYPKEDDPTRSIMVMCNNNDPKGKVPKKVIKQTTVKFSLEFAKALIKQAKSVAEKNANK